MKRSVQMHPVGSGEIQDGGLRQTSACPKCIFMVNVSYYLFAFSSLYVQILGKSTNLSHCCVAFLENKLFNNSV